MNIDLLDKQYFNKPFIILANGQYPSHPAALNMLHTAGTIICTDGSANKLLENGLTPNVIIGDMDSTTVGQDSFKGLYVKISDQDNTDLDKALEWCKVNNLSPITVLGTSQLREDHTIGNLMLLANYSDELDINFVTDYFTITCHHGKQSFTSFKQQLVSILPVEDIQSITTEGLEFPLIDEPFPLSSRGISNRATGHQFIITSSGKIWVFRSHSD
jgi:thiamine pyrophosphokinase|tara:strand:- start:21 stop:668 length:648 start_codon:yes stop_codon:yes gene_type:complete